MRRPSGALTLILIVAIAACDRSLAVTRIEILDVGRFNFTGGGAAEPQLVAEELSGFSRMRDDRYVSVGDDHATLYFLRISVDSRTGQVRSVSFDRPIALKDVQGRPIAGRGQSADREDVVYDAERGTVWIADERDAGDPSRPSLVEVDPSNGREVARLEVDGDGPLSVYTTIRPNYGFEAITRTEDSESMWTANEEALTIDGPLASPSEGSIVRLQEFDDDGRPERQVAYVTDPVGHVMTSPPAAVGEDRSGVSALIALHDEDELLVLERALAGDSSGMGGFRIRIYLTDTDDATDISAPPFRTGLAGRTDWKPAEKTLLFERRFGLPVANFEGMALGPRLANGDRSLLLIADNGGGTWQSIYALRLRGVP